MLPVEVIGLEAAAVELPKNVVLGGAVEEFKRNDRVTVIGYYDEQDETSRDIFHGVAQDLRGDYLFGHISHPAFGKSEGVKAPADDSPERAVTLTRKQPRLSFPL